MGWLQKDRTARADEKSCHVADYGRGEFLGCAGAFDGGIERLCDAAGNFSWIKAHQNTFYQPRTPISPAGVYFSPKTRDYFADEFIPSYRGILILLMQKHLEFQIVTPRTLADFQGKTLVLPDVRVLSDDEKSSLRKYVDSGRMLVITGEDAAQFGTAENVARFEKIRERNTSRH